MSEQELRQTLMELRRELAEVGEVDAPLEALLAEIRSDIDAVMDRAEPHTLSGRLQSAIERFEATHPELANAMGAVADQLAKIGV